MNREKLNAFVLWVVIIFCCSLLMTFSFYIFLMFVPIFIAVTLFCTLSSLNRKFFKPSFPYKKPSAKSSKIIDVEYQVMDSDKK